jgi:PD-(D/E)XK nuclease superfamily
MPFPKVFGTIDRAMKAFYMGQRSEAVATDMPPGVIGQADRWVKSAGLTIPGSSVVSEIRGSLDALVLCDDGSVGVVDFKTAEPNADHVATYSRQLHAYALALEQPFSSPAATVSALGLLCFLPDSFGGDAETAALTGQVEWFGIERDDPSFFRFLIEVASVLDADEPPPASTTCSWCRWKADSLAAS